MPSVQRVVSPNILTLPSPDGILPTEGEGLITYMRLACALATAILNHRSTILNVDAPVAQLDRAADSGSAG